MFAQISCAPHKIYPPQRIEGNYVGDLVLPGIDGQSIRLDRYRGQRVLLHFWASWCAPCAHEIGAIERLYRRLKPEGIFMIGIATQEDGSAARELASLQGVSFPLALDRSGSFGQMFGLSALPATYLVDGSGKLVEIPDPRDGTLVPVVLGPRDWNRIEVADRLISMKPN